MTPDQLAESARILFRGGTIADHNDVVREMATRLAAAESKLARIECDLQSMSRWAEIADRANPIDEVVPAMRGLMLYREPEVTK